MSEKHLQEAIVRRFKAMKRPERIAAVRKLASGSADDEAFVRDYFPDLYREAFLSPRPAAGARFVSTPRRARAPTTRQRGDPAILPIPPPKFPLLSFPSHPR